MNEGIKNAFSELYERSQYAQAMSKDKLTGHVTEITGATKDDTTTKCIVNTFLALEEFANFDLDTTDEISDKNINHVDRVVPITTSGNNTPTAAGTDDVNFAVSYTINLNLPETTNPEVFNAIFRALRDNLLTRR